MDTFFKVPMLLGIACLAACSSPMQVSSDYDKTAEFSQYKTYSFTDRSMQLPINQLNLNRLVQAVESNLAAKGLSSATDPDLLVDLVLTTEERRSATTYNTGPYAWRYGGGMSTINVEEYTEGTLIISLVDAKQERLLWQGVGTKTIDPDLPAEKREERIKEAVDQVMASYPPGN